KSDIENVTSAPIIGEIARNETQKTLVVTKGNRSFVTEQFRSIRTNLSFYSLQKDNFTLLITSTMSGEGKSFLSSNIAAAYALAGKKTILLEFDIRKPKVAENLGIMSKRGISSYIVSNEILD